MKCIILCAGYSEDNNDVVEPRSLLKVDENLTALDVLIEQVKEVNEVNQIYIVTNGKNYEKFLNWYANNKQENIKIINDNTTSPDAKLGAIGDIKFTLNCENIDDDLLIVAGDAIYDFDFQSVYEYYKEKKSAVVAVKHIEDILDLKLYGVIKFKDDNKVYEMREKVNKIDGNYIALALYFYPRETIRLFDYYLSEGNKTTSPGYFLEYLYQNMDVYAFEISGEYYPLK